MTPGRAASGRCRRARLPGLFAAAGLLAACAQADEPAAAVGRAERYGVFRDLVLVPRSESRGGPYFLDRFESTRRDWAAWLAATAQALPEDWSAMDEGEADLPVTRVSLGDARAFARWRFCRLPRFGEWEFAATAGGAYRFPWGDPMRAEWANTPQLGLGRATPAGTFESGRALDGPFDLVGNVAEWTESLAPRWEPGGAWTAARWPWSALLPVSPPPLLALLADGPPVPRLVAGGGYLGASGAGLRQSPRTPQVPVFELLPGEWSDDVGVRLATDPDALLRALLREPDPPDEAARAALTAFLALPAHRQALAPAWAGAAASVGEQGPLASLLRATLAP